MEKIRSLWAGSRDQTKPKPSAFIRKEAKIKCRQNIPVGTARIAYPHTTPDFAGMEPGSGAMGRGSGATSRLWTLGREVEVEVVLVRGKQQADISMSVGFGERGDWWFLRAIGKIVYYRG